MDVLDSAGTVIRTFTSDSASAAGTRLPMRAGLNRFIWDMTYPGPTGGARASRASGPMAAPGRFTVRLTSGGATTSQPLILRADPRVVRDGVTLGVMAEQFAYNLRARDLVSRSNAFAAELKAARTKAGASTNDKLASIEQEYFTPAIRYSRPGLDTHITYLYSMTLGADQPVSRDAKERLAELTARLDALVARFKGM